MNRKPVEDLVTLCICLMAVGIAWVGVGELFSGPEGAAGQLVGLYGFLAIATGMLLGARGAFSRGESAG